LLGGGGALKASGKKKRGGGPSIFPWGKVEERGCKKKNHMTACGKDAARNAEGKSCKVRKCGEALQKGKGGGKKRACVRGGKGKAGDADEKGSFAFCHEKK